MGELGYAVFFSELDVNNMARVSYSLLNFNIEPNLTAK